MAIYDISPLVHEASAVFPGDQPFSRKLSMSFHHGNHLELSSINTTVHIGAHADAPSHYASGAASINERDLNYYLGPCQVVSVPVTDGRILPEHWGQRSVAAQRVLFSTQSFPNPDHWHDEFASLSPELIQFLAQKGVITIGIDTPSIDPADSKELESHSAVFQNNMAVLEGLVLKDVPEGVYQLVALPLKIKGADASPVRAILIAEDQ